MNKEKILDLVITQAPRLLSQMDRNSISDTYGCFDRHYWNYRTVDFPGSRYQEAVLTLSLLYKIKSKINPYFDSENIKEWINAGVNFWCKIQSGDGSFSEWYPDEDSFVATAFTTAAISDTFLNVKDIIEKKDLLIESLKKSGDWLIKNKETRVYNQMAGAALALYNIYLITKEEKYRISAKEKIKIILSSQTDEGWWYEYEGPDVGYLSLMIDYLAKYYKKSGDDSVLKAIKKAINFIKYFIHPDGSSGGDYSSRNTEYLIPSGFSIISEDIEESSSILYVLKSNIDKEKGLVPGSFDDRYLSYICYNWLQYYMNYNVGKKKNLPCDESHVIKEFKKANILVWGDESYYLIVNFSKGGSFSLFTKKNNRKIFETGIIQRGTQNFFTGRILDSNFGRFENNLVTVRSKFSRSQFSYMTPGKMILSRLFQRTLGRSSTINKISKNLLRKLLVSKKGETDHSLNRKFVLGKEIVIEDNIELVPGVKEIILGQKFAEIMVPSSQYFQIKELDNIKKKIKVKSVGSLKIKRKIDSSGNISYEL